MRGKWESPEVLVTDVGIASVARCDVEQLRQNAERSARRRSRFCAHGSAADLLHEMIIVVERASYIRPHRHLGKSESIHVISGVADFVMFDDYGRPCSVVELGDFSSGRVFFLRVSEPVFHTLIVRTDAFVFHETTGGPWCREDTEYANWTPEASQDVEIRNYLNRIEASLQSLRANAAKVED